MNVKRILTALRLDKIAAVDDPCQAPALAAIIKRAADAETIWKAKYDTDQRKEMADKGEAMADGSYPIADAADLDNAIHAVGRGRNNSHAAIRAHIKTRAKALGLEDKLPESWADGAKLQKALTDAFEKSGIPLDDPDGDEGAQAFDEVLGEQQLTQAFWDAYYKGTNALQDSLLSIIKDDEASDKSSLISESIKQFADYIEQILPGDIGKSLAAGIAASVGQPGTTTGEVMTPELKKALGLPETATDAEVMKAIADKNESVTKAEGDLVKANEELEKAKAKAPVNDDDADDVKKALASGDAFQTPEGQVMRKRDFGTEAGYTFAKSANDRLIKQAAELAKRDDADAERSFAKRAEDLGYGAEFGPTLRKAYSGDATAQTELEKRIQGLQKQVEDGDFFKNFGHNAAAADSAEAEFMAKVDEVRKAQPTLTDAQAYTKAYTDRANAPIVKRMKDEARA